MKQQHFIFTFLFLCLILSAQAQVTSDWRSSNRDGIYEETNLLSEWPAQGPKLLWANDSLPKGYSAAAIGKDKIYVTGLVDTIDYLIALDLKGAEQWRRPIGKGWMNSFSDSRSTPTLKGNRVYAQSGTCVVACFDAESGKEIWNVDAFTKFSGKCDTWGYSESLLIVGDKILVSPGGDKTATVALNKNTGETIWKSAPLNDNASYCSPILVEENGKKIAINILSKHVYGVDVENGDILFKHDYAAMENTDALKVWPGAPFVNANTPIYHNKEIYVTSGYNHIGAKFKLSDDLSQMEVMWTDTILDVHFGGVVLIDGHIYGSNWINNAKGNWCCIDWETGKAKYEEKWNTKGNIIAANGMLYIYDEKRGNIGLVKATPEKFEVVSSFRVKHGKGPHWGHLVIKDGILYVRHANAIMAYDIKAASR